MPRVVFTRELNNLQDELLMLGSMAMQAVRESVDALKRQDVEKGRALMRADAAINRKRYAIEAECLRLIATQQPMARDLRLLAAILEIATELERIGDYAKGIGKIITLIGTEPPVKPLVDIPIMCDKALDMLRRSLDAFIQQDAETARAIPKEDDEIDALYNRVQRDIIEIILREPTVIDRANYLLWAAHNLERAADRVTNICERVVFTVTGEMMELDMELDAEG
ncbi:MAG: phosphate transport system regulatory protein PhoU [Caldilineae bacterium]|nr:MAG: phosphate transport system regulatory protein PhoU [Caldilineae bacterium]